jgi:hypothetical protein
VCSGLLHYHNITLTILLDSYSLSSKEKYSFWAVGIVETTLLAVSIIGCVSYTSHTLDRFLLAGDLHIGSLVQLHASNGLSGSMRTSSISIFFSMSLSASTSSLPFARATDNR